MSYLVFTVMFFCAGTLTLVAGICELHKNTRTEMEQQKMSLQQEIQAKSPQKVNEALLSVGGWTKAYYRRIGHNLELQEDNGTRLNFIIPEWKNKVRK